MSAGHAHALPATGNERALWGAFALTGTFLVAEAVGGYLVGSLALISDAAHMLTDTTAIGIAIAAIRIGRRPPDRRRTFGYARTEILAASFNAVLLFGVALYILWEAWQRFRAPVSIQSLPMLGIAALGLVVNLLSMRLLNAGRATSLNMKGAYLEVWSDMLGSLGVIVAALLIRMTGWQWLDPLVAVGIALWVLPRGWMLLRESLNVLLEGVPEGINLQAVRDTLLAVPDVASLHDLHVWAITTGQPSVTAHVVMNNEAAPEQLLGALREALQSKHALAHSTLQLERRPCSGSSEQACGIGTSARPEHAGLTHH